MRDISKDNMELITCHFMLSNGELVSYHDLGTACIIDLQLKDSRIPHSVIHDWIRKKLKCNAIRLLTSEEYHKVQDDQFRRTLAMVHAYEVRRKSRSNGKESTI